MKITYDQGEYFVRAFRAEVAVCLSGRLPMVTDQRYRIMTKEFESVVWC